MLKKSFHARLIDTFDWLLRNEALLESKWGIIVIEQCESLWTYGLNLVIFFMQVLFQAVNKLKLSVTQFL